MLVYASRVLLKMGFVDFLHSFSKFCANLEISGIGKLKQAGERFLCWRPVGEIIIVDREFLEA